MGFMSPSNLPKTVIFPCSFDLLGRSLAATYRFYETNPIEIRAGNGLGLLHLPNFQNVLELFVLWAICIGVPAGCGLGGAALEDDEILSGNLRVHLH